MQIAVLYSLKHTTENAWVGPNQPLTTSFFSLGIKLPKTYLKGFKGSI
jgi:hypothetical protein